ncbi:MAG: hypothetical protein H6825_04270 [Planctomycetes bacterium]|nr:hypothetical protein [Planctomycetota bacterium]
MKTLLLAALLVFLASVGDFCWRGLDAYARAGRARSALTERVSSTEALRAEQPLVSRARVDALAGERDALREQIGRRRLLLLDATLFRPPPHLSVLVPRWPALPVSPETLVAWGNDPHADAAVARLLEVLTEAQVTRVTQLALPDGAALHPLDEVPGVSALTIDLELVEELPVAIEALERLAPGQGEPALSVRTALLTRVDPEAWSTVSGTPHGPPVRLKLRLEVLFGAVVPGGAR